MVYVISRDTKFTEPPEENHHPVCIYMREEVGAIIKTSFHIKSIA